jgi:hypothetical protein
MKAIIGILAICSLCACAAPKSASQKPSISVEDVRQNADRENAAVGAESSQTK